jgi:hypothetical protein
MSEYPLPSYAANIWTVGDRLVLSFPSPVDAPAHCVEFPLTERGLLLALATIREREKAYRPAFLATRAAPSKYQIERALAEDKKFKAWLSEMAATKEKKEAEKAEATKFLEELGLLGGSRNEA